MAKSKKTAKKSISKATAKKSAVKKPISKMNAKVVGSAKRPAEKLVKNSAKKKIATHKKVVAEIVDRHSDEHEKPRNVGTGQRTPATRQEYTPQEFDSDLDSTSKALAPSDPVQMYLAELRKYPLLSKEQEFALAKKYYETHDPTAAQALVTANLRFVVKVAAEYSKFGARMIDLIQEGNMGLMHAVRDFNPYKGVRLITYAVWWIRGYIQEYMMKQYSMVKIGTTQNQKKLYYQLQKQKKALDAMGEVPDMKLIASKMGIPEEEVIEMNQRMSGRDVSLDQPLDDESSFSLKDLQRDGGESLDSQLERQEQIQILKEKISEIIPLLNEKEKYILEERILADEPLTLQEIGEKYGTTREAVRQMEVRVINKIKEKFQEKVGS